MAFGKGWTCCCPQRLQEDVLRLLLLPREPLWVWKFIHESLLSIKCLDTADLEVEYCKFQIWIHKMLPQINSICIHGAGTRWKSIGLIDGRCFNQLNLTAATQTWKSRRLEWNFSKRHGPSQSSRSKPVRAYEVGNKLHLIPQGLQKRQKQTGSYNEWVRCIPRSKLHFLSCKLALCISNCIKGFASNMHNMSCNLFDSSHFMPRSQNPPQQTNRTNIKGTQPHCYTIKTSINVSENYCCMQAVSLMIEIEKHIASVFYLSELHAALCLSSLQVNDQSMKLIGVVEISAILEKSILYIS